MAYTSLSDVIIPSVFSQYLTEQVSKKSALIASGAVVQSNMLNEYAAGIGDGTALPNFSEFTWSDPDVAKDDSTTSTPAAIGTGQQYAQKDFLSKSWGTTALTDSVIGEDVVQHVVSNVAAPYWAQTVQEYALAKLSGVIKDNIANDSGDMVSDTSDADGDNATADNLFGTDTFVEARQSMGDAAERLSLVVMHSRVYSNLLKAEPHNCAPKSATQPFNTYMGLAVIIDDSMPSEAGATSGTVYTTYLLGQGALLMGEATPSFGPVDVLRGLDQGNGFGAEKLITRKQMILHPQGFRSSATVTSANGSPTRSQYDAASAWDRVYGRKNCPIVAFKTNG